MSNEVNGSQHPSRTAADSGELLRLLIESATDYAIFSMDPDGLVTSWNTGAEHVLGFREDEILGRSADVMFPPEEGGAEAGNEERRRALADGRAEDERWQMRRDGSRFWASGLLMPLADPSNGFVKIIRERTKQHEAEQRLRESEERFRLLATSIPQLVFRSRPDGERSWGSPQWIEFTGLGLEASLELGWLDAVHPEDRDATMAAWRDAQASGNEYYAEQRVQRLADGEWRWHQTRARPLPDSLEREWVGTMTDIHELRTLQDRQKVLLAELQHRTRNLLAVVQSIARQTLRTSASVPGFGAEFESRLRALGRVQGLLASADNGPIPLRDLIEAELTAHGDGGDPPGKVQVDGPPVTLPPGSAQTLALALHELATNAVKYGALAQPAGKLTVTWRVEGAGAERRVVLDWGESNVAMPEGELPPRKGYGSELIERAIPYQLKAKTRLEFGVNGVRCAIEVPITVPEQQATHG